MNAEVIAMNFAVYEALAERLLICSFALRDTPSWAAYADALSAMGEIGAHLKEWDQACEWTDTAIAGTQTPVKLKRI